MKVTRDNGIRAVEIYAENKLKPVHERGTISKKGDTIEISKEGKEIAKYVSIVKNISDIRVQKIEDLKQKIESGKYDVSSEDIAKKIVNAIKGKEI
ncbi:MAG TPA: flagellar biosynthesis anti-sigma factor FlgM [Clostridiaceae bacterium]|nr:flagellar biosynthesis anti-sigma factor FlgM [Clostridiaceae bacterium]